jgi:hypothetical protein
MGIGCVASTSGFCHVTLKLPADGAEFAPLFDTADTLTGALGELTANAEVIPAKNKATTEKVMITNRFCIMHSQSRSSVLMNQMKEELFLSYFQYSAFHFQCQSEIL